MPKPSPAARRPFLVCVASTNKSAAASSPASSSSLMPARRVHQVYRETRRSRSAGGFPLPQMVRPTSGEPSAVTAATS